MLLPPTVLGHGGLHDVVTQQEQFGQDPRYAPCRVLAAFIRLLRQPGSDKITPEELAEAWGKFGARSDEAIGRLMEEFWPGNDYTYRWRTTKALGVLNSPASRKALLELALGSRKNDLPWVRGAARQYVEIITDKSEARRLLVSNDTDVLQNAAVGLRGVAIDKEMLTRLLELTKSPDRHLRFLVVCNFGEDPGGQFASEKVAAIVQAIPDIATMDGADKVSGMMAGSSTNAEFHYRTYIGALAKLANGGKALDDALSRAQAGGPTWRCLVLARAFGGNAKSRPEVRKILSDAEAGLFRDWAAEALGKIGTADDLPLLRDVAEKDPMQREQGGCRAPLNKQLYYPVRQAAQQAIKALQAEPGTPGATRPASNGASPDGAGPQPAASQRAAQPATGPAVRDAWSPPTGPASTRSVPTTQPGARLQAWRDEESETLRSLSSEELVRRMGMAQSHASAEPPGKFSVKGAFIDGRTPDAASPKSAIVGHFH